MRTARSLETLTLLFPDVAADDQPRYGEIVGFLATSPRRVPPSWLPLWSRAMTQARRDLGEILCHCCRDHHGEDLARELLARIPEECDPLD